MPVTSTPTGTSRRKKIVAATLVLLLLIALPAWYVFGRTDRSHTVHADFEYVNGIYVAAPSPCSAWRSAPSPTSNPRGPRYG